MLKIIIKIMKKIVQLVKLNNNNNNDGGVYIILIQYTCVVI
jgi:hypothetical protein